MTQINGPSPSPPRLLGNSARVGLVLIGWTTDFDEMPSLKRLAAAFNKAQKETKLFEFVAMTPRLRVSGTAVVGTHYLAHEVYFQNLEPLLQQTPNMTAVIGITKDGLFGDCFNKHKETAHVGIVTMEDMEKHCPITMSEDQYLFFLILCETFCCVAGVNFEIPDAIGCLFDPCVVKKRLRVCLQDPQIVTESRRRLIANGFTIPQVDGAADLLSMYVRKKRLRNRIPRKVLMYISACGSTSLLHSIFYLVLHPQASLWVMLFISLVAVVVPAVAYKKAGFEIGPPH